METYITTQTTLAVFLTVRGHTHIRLERRGKKCAWVFQIVGNFRDLLEQYFNGDADVDVEDALKTAADLRTEMYEFLAAAQ